MPESSFTQPESDSASSGQVFQDVRKVDIANELSGPCTDDSEVPIVRLPILGVVNPRANRSTP